MVRAVVFLVLPILSLAASNNLHNSRSTAASARTNKQWTHPSDSLEGSGGFLYQKPSLTSSHFPSDSFSIPSASVHESSKQGRRDSRSFPSRDTSYQKPDQHRALIKRADNDGRVPDRGNLLTQGPSRPGHSAMRVALTQAQIAKMTPMKTHIRTHISETARNPQARQIFTPLRERPASPPQPAPRTGGTPPGSPRTMQEITRDPNQASSSRTHATQNPDQPSPSQLPATQRDNNPSAHSGTVGTAGSETVGTPTAGSQTLDRTGSQNLGRTSKGNIITKYLGLTIDWASSHPKLACAAGLGLVAGCSSVAGAGLIGFGAHGTMHTVGVGLSMLGSGLGATVGTSGAVVAVDQYKKNEAITEERMQRKFDEVVSKAIPKVPSLGRISENFKAVVGDSAFTNLGRLKLGMTKRPSSDSLSSLGLTEPIPEEAPTPPMWSAPTELPSQRRQRSRGFRVPKNLFRSRAEI